MGDKKMIYKRESSFGVLWIAGWMFCIGFAKLTFGKALLALVVWPYYLGALLSAKP